MQTLVGDSTDNYKGCPSVGPVKANKLLDESETTAEAWSNILKAFDKAGLSSQHALVQARLAKILRHENYDYQTKTIKHWEPPNAES
jgi:DNA polymerase-1